MGSGRARLAAGLACTYIGLLALPGLVGRAGAHVVHHREPRAAASARAVSPMVLHSAGGERVKVRSTAYTAAEIQPLVDALASFPHRAEIGSVTLFVATPAQLEAACGSSAMACYDPWIQQIYVSGDPDDGSGVPREFVLAHEYGHHLANHRGNAPWSALEWGTKRWATYEGVCSGVRSGRLSPGDQGLWYWSNPGEAFAQSYAELAMPSADVPWHYEADLEPDSGALRAIRRDTLHPLRGPRRMAWRMRFGAAGPRVRVRRIATPLDGRIRIAVRERPGRDVRLRVLAGGTRRVLARSQDTGRREIARVDLCGERAVRVEVRVRRGAGRFAGRLQRP